MKANHPKWTCTPPEPAPCGRQVRRTKCGWFYQGRDEAEEMCHGSEQQRKAWLEEREQDDG